MDKNSKSSQKKTEKTPSVDDPTEKIVKKQKKTNTDSKVTQQTDIDSTNEGI